MQWLLRKIVGTKNERDVRRMRPLVARINKLEEELQALTDDQLKAKTAEFKERLAQGETLSNIELEAFAVVKNACRRLCGTVANVCDHTLTWEMVPFDVQLIGGLSLHYGKIAEMATGEGKTLVATMPAYLNALTGQGVHVVTVNDYLARRDSEWMGLVYTYLGLTVGCIQSQMDPATRRRQYACDITYGTNSEFGFDYLRDMGMAYRPEDQVQRGHAYAIVDEIDSILIDEARTPLIISGPAPYSTQQYVELKPFVERLYRRQRELCNQLVQEAKALLEKGDSDEAMRKLYQVNQGMPKHPQLQRMLEEASVRRLLEKIEAMMLTDMHKEEGRSLREELYFVIEEKHHDASLTEKGCEALSPNDPDAYLLPDIVSAMSELDGDASLTEEQKFEKRQEIQNAFANRSERIHAVDQLIRAYSLYERDVQYVVQENQVVIVDENTGRLMVGRRWSDGLHQAVEAKEGVKIERETQTLATITIQNYFRLYKKLAGMTGTAETEADEFHQIYKLDVMVIPTNRPVRRMDYNDFIYKTQREKYNAIIQEIVDCHQRGQPVLVGTISVEASELVSRMLRRQNIPHNVLNAKNHQREAEIVANAGQPGAVTIATNMAGRGTDIKLGPGVVHLAREVITSQASLDSKIEGKTLRQLLLDKPAGLHVIGSERHESRRIDRQLRGRCARQGDPGSSRFYVSLEDDLMRIFGSDRISKLMEKLGIEEGEVMEHRWLNKSIERAQRRVEQHNFSIRKRTLDYDDVMNKQREIIYGFRSEVLQSAKVSEHLLEVAGDMIAANAETMIREDDEDGIKQFVEWVNTKFPVGLKRDQLPEKEVSADAATDLVLERVKQAYEVKIKTEDPERLASMERYIILNAVDTHWQEYLRGMDALRQGVGLRAYGQRDPLVEYKREAYTMFSDLMDKIKSDVTDRMFRSATSLNAFQSFLSALPKVQTQHASVTTLGGGAGASPSAPPRAMNPQEAAMQAALARKPEPVRRDLPKVGRNDPCPCGSGKKYKQCHGRNG
ncbi:MAG TPA: preprotein translocase subunit SecA [Kiritimatiellia bacterium]|nr:preprotein translocase subunit SecA [Kiritimatiellia bacterium]HMO98900.1 preprotein translocase subunit SecA [Kiritimatiellia bacterium]HMP96832.1 preprotein translocase subunit SecA [Kiritimatiellia bacterium]